MKKLLIFLFSLLISLNSYGEWKYIITNANDYKYFIDMDKIVEKQGYIYYWQLTDYPGKDQFGSRSAVVYYQGDCEIFGHKSLHYYFYKGQMGEGAVESQHPVDNKWNYLPPKSVNYIALNWACDYVK